MVPPISQAASPAMAPPLAAAGDTIGVSVDSIGVLPATIFDTIGVSVDTIGVLAPTASARCPTQERPPPPTFTYSTVFDSIGVLPATIFDTIGVSVDTIGVLAPAASAR